jgi:hypothetical protein
LSPLQKLKQIIYIAGGTHLTLLSTALCVEWPRSLNSSPRRGKNFLCVVQTGSGAHLASYPTSTGEVFPRGGKQPEREADKSPPTIVLRSRTRGSIHSNPPYAFMAQCLLHYTGCGKLTSFFELSSLKEKGS